MWNSVVTLALAVVLAIPQGAASGKAPSREQPAAGVVSEAGQPAAGVVSEAGQSAEAVSETRPSAEAGPEVSQPAGAAAGAGQSAAAADAVRPTEPGPGEASTQPGSGVSPEESEGIDPSAQPEREKSEPGDVCGAEIPNAFYEFSVPTQVYTAGGEFFLADAYHHQILCTKDYRRPPCYWSVVGDKLNRPHALASDGTLYVVVDTDNNRVVTYARGESGFQVVECFEEVGVRPHYIEYDAESGLFYVWSSMTGTMYLYERVPDTLRLELKKTAVIRELDGCYTRSFTIDGDSIYLPSMGKSAIYVVDKNTFKVEEIHPVSAELAGMVQVRHEQNYYYLVTSSDAAGDQTKATIVRSRTLSGFTEEGCENVSGSFPGLVWPLYYITRSENGHYYAPVIKSERSCICQFDIVEDRITNVTYTTY